MKSRRNWKIGTVIVTVPLLLLAVLHLRGERAKQARLEPASLGAPGEFQAPGPGAEQTRELAELGNPGAVAHLVQSYQESPRQGAARAEALDALFRIRSLPVRLRAVLDAVSADRGPVASDPLWTTAVDQMAKTWIDAPSEIAGGRDLMLLESRERPRLLLAAAMARVAQSPAIAGYRDHDRHAFAADLVDVYFDPGSEIDSELEDGIRALAGEDVARVLTEGATPATVAGLTLVQEREKQVSEALEHVARGKAIPLPERPAPE